MILFLGNNTDIQNDKIINIIEITNIKNSKSLEPTSIIKTSTTRNGINAIISECEGIDWYNNRTRNKIIYTLEKKTKTYHRIKINLNPELSIRGVLLTMFDKRNKLSSEVDSEARKFFKNKVYETVIPRNVRLSEAPSHGAPVLIYDKTCIGSKSYLSFTEEFLKQENALESAA